MGRALIFWGGWDGHQPQKLASIIEGILVQEGFEVVVREGTKCLEEQGPVLKEYQLIVPDVTMSEIGDQELAALASAVESGTGLAGVHGGMGDSFRNCADYQFITGGQFVAHPGGIVDYAVLNRAPEDPLMKGIPDFSVKSEQYYMHVDPSNRVLASTKFPTHDGPHVPNGPFEMPVAWTRLFGKGRVYYCSLGHEPEIYSEGPAREMLRRGLVWAAGITSC